MLECFLSKIPSFVSSGKRKNKNTSDIALTLEVVNDLIIKTISVVPVVISYGDINFYPLIAWIREHTDKGIFTFFQKELVKFTVESFMIMFTTP